MTLSFDERAKDWDTPQNIETTQGIAEFIKKNLTFKKGMTGFEYGCGTGLLSFCLLPQFKQITLADNSVGMLDVLKEKIQASGAKNMTPIQLDLIKDPPPETHFDLIYSLLAFHHIPDTDRILKEFHALLTDDGSICIVDLDKEDGSFHGDGFDGHLGFERNDLGAKAAQAGFHDIRFETCYIMEEEVNGELQKFPLFMMVCQK